MRSLVLSNFEKWMEPEQPPNTALIAAMQRYKDEIRKAGVMLAAERLHATAAATCLQHIACAA